MAILTKNENNETIASYTGMVVDKFSRDERVMSDVWERCTYAVVYDIITDTAEEICVCSNFGATSSAEVDASPALMAQYKAHLVREQRHRDAVRLHDKHERRLNECHHMNVSIGEYKKLRLLGNDTFEILYTLLGTKNFRNNFRKSMADQVRAWLADENPKYRTPLSSKQLACVDTRHYGRRFYGHRYW